MRWTTLTWWWPPDTATGPLARSLEAHLETCPNCPPLYASLVETLADLRALEDSRGVDELANRVLAALDEYPLPPEEDK